jgi:predicted DNA binding protein
MSVLKAHRSDSKAEFVNTANKIYVQTINFLSRLSSRYSRLVADFVAELTSDVVDNAEKANSIYPSDETRKELRKRHLLELL